MSDQRQEWDRQPDEPGNWFSRFEAFRALGPVRSLLRVYNAEREKAGKGVTTSIPAPWNAAAARWRWRDRAEAFDAEQQRLARQQEAAELEQRRRKWRDTGMALQGRGIEKVAAMAGTDLTPREAVLFITEGQRLEALGRGEPTEITDQTHHADGQIKIREIRVIQPGENRREFERLYADVAAERAAEVPPAIRDRLAPGGVNANGKE